MPDFPTQHHGGFTELIINTTVTADAAANTKGAYQQMTSATGRDFDWLMVGFENQSSARSHLVDVSVGAASSEQVIVPNMLVSGGPRMVQWLLIPKSIAAGSRLAARTQCTIGSSQIRLGTFAGVGGLWRPPNAGNIIALGVNTGTSRGTAVDAGAVLNTYSAWVQLEASTPAAIQALSVQFGSGTNATPTALGFTFGNAVDIGVGGAGSEVPIITMPYVVNSTLHGPLPNLWHSVSIPAGSRLAARVRMSTVDATDRVVDVMCHGLVI